MSDDVIFTYSNGGKPVTQLLRWADRIASREGLGTWHVGARAWKVFVTRSKHAALLADYARAGADAGLPIGTPKFQQGSVKRGTARSTEGFVLITEWMVGTSFLHTASSFRSALIRENFPRAISSVDYQRVKRGAEAAYKAGLKDPQGFLRAGLFEPLRFFDVHTSWNPRTGEYGHSEVAREIMEIAIAWGQ